MKSVDWTKWSAVAEILSATAIVVTLAYLAIQTRYVREQTELQNEQNAQNIELLRQNNEALEAQSRYNHAIAIADYFGDLSVDDDLGAFIVKGIQGLELTPTEELRLRTSYLRTFTVWDWEFHEDQLGRIDAPTDLWLTLIRETPDETGFFYPGMRRAWETQKRIVSPDLREFIDRGLLDAAQE